MFDMANHVEVKRLLQELAAAERRLTANEREMYRSIKAKYDEPGHSSFDDKICLEVMLRNIEIRQGYGLETGEGAERVIEMPRTPERKT